MDTRIQGLFYILFLRLPNIYILYHPKDAQGLCLDGSPTGEQAATYTWSSAPSFPSPNLQTVPLFLLPDYQLISCPPPLEETFSHHWSPLLSIHIFPQLFFFITSQIPANFNRHLQAFRSAQRSLVAPTSILLFFFFFPLLIETPVLSPVHGHFPASLATRQGHVTESGQWDVSRNSECIF